MLFCVNPELESMSESLSTLQMAAGSQLVRNQRKQQFISVQGEFYNLGNRNRVAGAMSPGGVPLTSPSNASTMHTPGLAGRDLVEDSVDSTTAAPESTEDGHMAEKADAQMRVVREENRALRVKLENLESDALEQIEVKKELKTKVQVLESQCTTFQRQLAVHEEYFQGMLKDQATLTTATPRSSQSQLPSAWATPCLQSSVSEAASQATPTREGDDSDAVEKRLEAAFWRQEAERLQVELDSLRTGIPAEQLRSIRSARAFWNYSPADRAALSAGASPARSRSAASAPTGNSQPPAACPAGIPPPMPTLDVLRSESEEDSAKASPAVVPPVAETADASPRGSPRQASPPTGKETPPRGLPASTENDGSPRNANYWARSRRSPEQEEDLRDVPCVALTLTSPGPVELRDAVIQTRDSRVVRHFASGEDA
jgi:hypothetical protein